MVVSWNLVKSEKVIEYDTKAKQVFDEVKGYDSIKCNVVFGSAISNIQLGNLEEAEKIPK